MHSVQTPAEAKLRSQKGWARDLGQKEQPEPLTSQPSEDIGR